MLEKVYKAKRGDSPWGNLVLRQVPFYFPLPGEGISEAELEVLNRLRAKYTEQGHLSASDWEALHKAFRVIIDQGNFLEHIPDSRKATYNLDPGLMLTCGELEEVKTEKPKTAKKEPSMPSKPKAPKPPSGESPSEKLLREHEEKMKKINDQKEALEKEAEAAAEAKAKEELRLSLREQLAELEPTKKGIMSTIGGPVVPTVFMMLMAAVVALFKMFATPTRRKKKRRRVEHVQQQEVVTEVVQATHA